jgi:exodeoxyribonuclease-3
MVSPSLYLSVRARRVCVWNSTFSKVKPVSVEYGIGIPEHDGEGRVITTEFERFYLVNTYIPNAGQKLER